MHHDPDSSSTACQKLLSNRMLQSKLQHGVASIASMAAACFSEVLAAAVAAGTGCGSGGSLVLTSIQADCGHVAQCRFDGRLLLSIGGRGGGGGGGGGGGVGGGVIVVVACLSCSDTDEGFNVSDQAFGNLQARFQKLPGPGRGPLSGRLAP